MSTRWLPAGQAAAFLQMPQPTFYRWVEKGRLPFTLSGSGRRMFPVDLLPAFLARRAPAAADPRWLTLAEAVHRTGLDPAEITAAGHREQVATRPDPTADGERLFALRDLRDLLATHPAVLRIVQTQADLVMPGGAPMTTADWEAAYEAQNGCCAVCGTALVTADPLLECDLHPDGTFRQLVCVECPWQPSGTGTGVSESDPDI